MEISTRGKDQASWKNHRLKNVLHDSAIESCLYTTSQKQKNILHLKNYKYECLAKIRLNTKGRILSPETQSVSALSVSSPIFHFNLRTGQSHYILQWTNAAKLSCDRYERKTSRISAIPGFETSLHQLDLWQNALTQPKFWYNSLQVG